MAILQDCMDMPRGEHGLCTEICSTSSVDRSQFVFVNVDEVTDIKQEDDPELTASTVIKTEPTVSLKFVCFLLYTCWTKIEMLLSLLVTSHERTMSYFQYYIFLDSDL
jgi:hypothetical protein